MKLLDLPYEIRAQIIHHVVVCPNTDSTVHVDTNIQHPFHLLSPATQPLLAHVSRQLRSEVLNIFYANNDFVIALLNEHSVRLAQRWIECTKQHFKSLKGVVFKVYPSFDGRSLGYREFRWHAHGPYWLRLRFVDRAARQGARGGEVVYVLGVTELAGIVARLWSTKRDGWLVTSVDMVVATLAKQLEEIGWEIRVVCPTSE